MFLFRDKQIPLMKELKCSLQVVWGVGWRKSLLIITKLGISTLFFANNLNSYNFSSLSFLLKGFILSESRIRRLISTNVKELIDINSYKGIRHSLFLPVRGQRTRTNAGTRRSLRKSKI